MKSQRRTGIVLSYLNTFLNMSMNLILVPMLITALSDDDYSLYKVIQSFSGPLMMFNLGMSTVVARAVARYSSTPTDENKKEKENTFALAGIVSFAMAGVILLIGYAMTYFLPLIFRQTYSVKQLQTAKKLMMIFVATTALHIGQDSFRGCILGSERFNFFYGSTTFRYIARFVMIAGLAKYTDLNVLIVAAIDLFLYAVLLILNVLYCYFTLRERMHLHRFKRQDLMAITSFSVAILLQAIVNQVNNNMDTVILGAMITDTRIITMYSAALSIYSVYNSLLSVVSNVYFPKAVGLVEKNASGHELTTFIIPPGRIQAILAVGILGGFFLFGGNFIGLWIGTEYQEAHWVALCLMVPVTIPLVQNVCLSILDAKLKRLFRSVTLVLMAMINIIISIILIHFLGYWGAAIGTVISITIGHIILMNVYYMKVIKLEVFRLFREIFAGILPAGILCCVCCVPFVRWTQGSWLHFLIGCIVFVVLYAILVWFVALSKSEKGKIKDAFPHHEMGEKG